MMYTMDTRIGQLLDDTKAVEVLEKRVPGISRNPAVTMARGMSLKSLADNPQAKQMGVTQAKLQQVLDEVNKVKK